MSVSHVVVVGVPVGVSKGSETAGNGESYSNVCGRDDRDEVSGTPPRSGNGNVMTPLVGSSPLEEEISDRPTVAGENGPEYSEVRKLRRKAV